MIIGLPPNVHRAVQRARWLGELATALDHASKLAIELCDHRPDSAETFVLCGHILALRSEVDSFRKRRPPDNDEAPPNRMH